MASGICCDGEQTADQQSDRKNSGELRGLVDTDDGQGFIIAVNDGASSTVCATGKPEALVAVVATMATEPAIREVFEEAARQCSSRWPSAPPDVSGSGSET